MPSNACDVRVSESNCMKNGSRLLRCSVKTPPNKAVGWLRIAENSSGRPPGTKHLRKMPKFAGKEMEPRALITSLEIGKLPITKPSQHSEFCIKALCRAQQPPAPRPQGTDSQSEPRPQARGRGPSVRPEFELRGTVEPAAGPPRDQADHGSEQSDAATQRRHSGQAKRKYLVPALAGGLRIQCASVPRHEATKALSKAYRLTYSQKDQVLFCRGSEAKFVSLRSVRLPPAWLKFRRRTMENESH